MDKFKVLVSSFSFGKICNEPENLLKRNKCELVYDRGPFSDDELARIIGDYFAIIAGEDEIGLQTLRKANKLRIIAKHGIGLDKINIPEATKRRIVVTRALGANEETVADYTFALILGIARGLVPASISLGKGLWEGPKYTGIEIHQKVLGIVGLGSIGKSESLSTNFKILKAFLVETVLLELALRYLASLSTPMPLSKEAIGNLS